MGYNVHFQTMPAYKGIKYGQGTVYTSGCGCAALCNALDALGIARVSVKAMCAYAVSVGARVTGGTDEATLLKHTAKKYGFTYRTTSKNAELLAHLKSGGVAILHGGSAYKLFSDSGHFVCAVAASGNTVTVLDSFWYDGKYKRNAIRRNYASVVNDGIIKTSIVQCGKATADRSPSYYLISKSGKGDNKKEVEDMTEAEVRKIIADEATKQAKLAVSDWAKSAWADAVEAKLLDDDRPQAPMTRQEFAAELVKIGFAGRTTEPSDWAKAAWTATEQAGVMTGDPHGYVTREMLAQVLKNVGLVGAGVKE
nr:MAG TPA: peptidase [Caudoviricetes sp.]